MVVGDLGVASFGERLGQRGRVSRGGGPVDAGCGFNIHGDRCDEAVEDAQMNGVRGLVGGGSAHRNEDFEGVLESSGPPCDFSKLGRRERVVRAQVESCGLQVGYRKGNEARAAVDKVAQFVVVVLVPPVIDGRVRRLPERKPRHLRRTVAGAQSPVRSSTSSRS
jgi:hypothetical protein